MTELHNGECRTRTGYRAVAFAPNLGVKPVLYAVYSGYSPNRGTVQKVAPDDIIARIDWSDRGSKSELYLERGGVQVPPTEAADLWAALHERHPWLREWLAPQRRGPSFLPKEVVPENRYLAVVAKRRRLQRFIERFGVPYEADQFQRSPRKGLRLEPRPLDIDLDNYLPTSECWTGSVVGIERYERWFGSPGDGSPAVELKTQPESECGSNYAHSRTSRQPGRPGIEGWRGYHFIVRVQHGAYTSNHYSHGLAVDTWQVPA